MWFKIEFTIAAPQLRKDEAVTFFTESKKVLGKMEG